MNGRVGHSGCEKNAKIFAAAFWYELFFFFLAYYDIIYEHSTLFMSKRFMLDELFQQNSSKTILLEYQNLMNKKNNLREANGQKGDF